MLDNGGFSFKSEQVFVLFFVFFVFAKSAFRKVARMNLGRYVGAC